MDRFVLLVGFCFASVFLWSSFTDGQSTPADDGGTDIVLDKDWSYCFEFTWFGPEYNNFSRYDGTCPDYLDETRAENIPCSPPIVITYDGYPPDIKELWDNYRTSVLCKRSGSQVCAKYTYSLNGQVSNTTYMCTKVLVEGGGRVTSGCYTQTHDDYDIEVCVCESVKGIYMPCNGGSTIIFSTWIALLGLMVLNYLH